MMVREEVERARGAKLLALKKERRTRRQEQHRRHSPVAGRTCLLMSTTTVRRVGNLIVIIEIVHKSRGRYSESRLAARAALAPGILALIEKSPFQQRDKFLSRAAVVAVVELTAPRQGHHGGALEV